MKDLRNLATAYEIAAWPVADHDTKTLIAYSAQKSRVGLLKAMQGVGDAIIRLTQMKEKDSIQFFTKPFIHAVIQGEKMPLDGRFHEPNPARGAPNRGTSFHSGLDLSQTTRKTQLMPTELIFHKPGTPEWDALWARFRQDVEEDTTALNQAFNETWQYMGTVVATNGRAKAVEHQFRHRMHPVSQQREYRNIAGRVESARRQPIVRPAAAPLEAFDAAECGGAFDGFVVASDADSGL